MSQANNVSTISPSRFHNLADPALADAKVARAALSAAVHEHDHHEDEHTERVVDLAHDAETDAACTLVSIKATTSAGLVALLRYEMWGTSHFAMPRDRNDFSFGDLVNRVGPLNIRHSAQTLDGLSAFPLTPARVPQSRGEGERVLFPNVFGTRQSLCAWRAPLRRLRVTAN